MQNMFFIHRLPVSSVAFCSCSPLRPKPSRRYIVCRAALAGSRLPCEFSSSCLWCSQCWCCWSVSFRGGVACTASRLWRTHAEHFSNVYFMFSISDNVRTARRKKPDHKPSYAEQRRSETPTLEPLQHAVTHIWCLFWTYIFNKCPGHKQTKFNIYSAQCDLLCVCCRNEISEPLRTTRAAGADEEWSCYGCSLAAHRRLWAREMFAHRAEQQERKKCSEHD